MRKIIALLILLLQYVSAGAQCNFPDLDYNDYYEVFSDDFDYDPSNFQSDKAFTQKWWIPPGSNPCVGNSSCWIEPSQITMPERGIIRLTETTAPQNAYCGEPKDHISGWLHTQLPYFVDYGIIEASIRIPPEQDSADKSAFPTFWVPNYYGYPASAPLPFTPKRNELDIFDNHDGAAQLTWSKFYTYDYPPSPASILQAADANWLNRKKNPCIRSAIDLSEGFHRISVLWTPSRVIFYVDRHYVRHYDYDGAGSSTQVAKTVKQMHSLIIALQTHTQTVPGLSMDIDWVRYLALQCYNGSFIVDADHPDRLTNPPNLPPDHITTGGAANFNMLRYKNIVINDARPTPYSPITAPNKLATVMEAESTTILPNFLADQSATTWGSSITNLQDSSKNWIAIPVITNGYMEILPGNCESHPSAGEH